MRDQMMLTLLVYRDRGRRCQTADQIHRYEGRVDRNRNQAIGILLGRPFEPGGKAGERPEAGKRTIWQDQKREGIKTAGIAIGADRDFLHLRRQPGQKMRDQRLAPQLHEGFIGAAQARPGATGEDQTGNHVLIKPGIKPGIKRASSGDQTGANDGDRTRDNRYHKPALYQLSYVRHQMRCIKRGGSYCAHPVPVNVLGVK